MSENELPLEARMWSPDTKEKTTELADTFEGPTLAPIWDTKRITEGRWEFTDEVSGVEQKVLKITLSPGDLPSIGDKDNPRERAEISETQEISVPPETKATYSFKFYIPSDFPIPGENVVIAQIKQQVENKEHPIISLRVEEKKLKLVIVEGTTKENFNKHKISLPYTTNEWHTVSISYEFKKDRTGTCTLTLGDQEPQTYTGHLGYDHLPQEGLYFKLGIYRPAVPKEQSIYFSDFKREIEKPGTEAWPIY